MNDRQRREQGTSRVLRASESDDGAFDREFWARVPLADRLAMVWDLVLEYLEWQGQLPGGEPRLQRSVCRIERRPGDLPAQGYEISGKRMAAVGYASVAKPLEIL
jgi:hypothetical protein